MIQAQKVSISVASDDLKWLRKRAKQAGGNLSAVVAEATRLLRQREARERLLGHFGDDAIVTPEQADEIRAKWRA
jgi:hypothetical protein